MTDYSYLYNTKRWKQIRRLQLEQDPLCIMCEEQGKLTPATVCDHIVPHKGDITLFTSGPFQSLCKLHHDSTKQRQEHDGIIRGGRADGTPTDPRHHWARGN
jgi:5-methylcytosine-specific restriction endonuclease McrA